MAYHIIGLGSIGMRHAQNLLGLGKVVFGTDPDKTRIDKLVKAGGYDHKSNGLLDYAGTLVCTPTSMHFDGLVKGMVDSKVVFVEKPLGLPGETEFLVEAIRGQKKGMVGCHLRFHPCVIRARNWLPSIGDLQYAKFGVNQYNDKYSDPVVLNWGSHEIDLAQHLLGPLEFMQGYGSDRRMVLTFMRDNADVEVDMDYLTWPHQRGFFLSGTKGNIFCDLEKGLIEQSGEKNRSYHYEGPYNGIYIDEMKAFIGLCEGTRSKNDSYATLQDGIDVLRLIERSDTGGSYGWTGRKVEKVGPVKAERSKRKVRSIAAA